MYTIIEAPAFKDKADRLWTTRERLEFLVWLAHNPLAGDVIPKGGGLRKVRWQHGSKGKRGGVRIIYFNRLANGTIFAIDIYSKNEKTDLTAQELHQLKGAKHD